MKETLGLIPQVFYDVIGRFVPGAAILTVGIGLLSDESQANALVKFVTGPPAAPLGILVFVWLIASYLLGLLLGAIGFVCFEDGIRQGKFGDIKQRPPGAHIRLSDIPLVYDYILIRDPAAGVRLVKLRAESHLARALFIGCILLAVLYFFRHWSVPDRTLMVVLFSLAGTAVAAFLFQRHVQTRAWRLQINCWMIFSAEQTSASTGATGSATRAPHLPIRPPTSPAGAHHVVTSPSSLERADPQA